MEKAPKQSRRELGKEEARVIFNRILDEWPEGQDLHMVVSGVYMEPEKEPGATAPFTALYGSGYVISTLVLPMAVLSVCECAGGATPGLIMDAILHYSMDSGESTITDLGMQRDDSQEG